jgi:hypothetical protein
MSAPERCPGCGASIQTVEGSSCLQFECGTLSYIPGKSPENPAPSWVHTRSRACELLEESVEVIHQLQGELEALTTPPAVTHQSAENALPVRAYFTSRRMVPESLQKLRGKAQVFLGMASQAFSVVTHQDHHPEPERLRLVYGPDMKRAVQQLADLREEVLLFIDLLQAPRR